jgi:glycosyltransferase involved in cell wall biosynthesis
VSSPERTGRRAHPADAARGEQPVLLVTGHVPPDRVGAMRALHEREGIEIAIYDGRLHHATAGVENPGVPYRRVTQWQVRALAASGDYRAVIATSAGRIALPAAYLGAHRGGVPFLYWSGIWAQLTTPAHLAAAPLIRRIERRADAVIAYGPHVADYVRSHGARNVHVAPQPVDVEFWSAAAEGSAARAEAGDPPFLALFAGRDAPGKGVRELLAAWRRADTAWSGGLLALAGPAPGDGELADQAAPGRGAGRPVLALGPVDTRQLRNFYAAADVLIVPSVPTRSFREPWGLVANEAMLQGTCVIATDSVGAAAGGLVRDGDTGLVVPAGDEPAMTRAIDLLASDPALRTRLGEAGRKAAREYGFEQCAAGVSRALASVGRSRAGTGERPAGDRL